MTLDLATWENEKDAKPFTFNIGPKPYTLPHLMDAPGSVISALEAGEMHTVFTTLLDEQQAREILACKLGAIVALAEAWQEHSGEKPGEGSASAGS